MSWLNKMCESFEEKVLCNKRRLTEHERTILLGGVMELHALLRHEAKTKGKTLSKEIHNELILFGQNSLANLHAFYCDGCSEVLHEYQGTPS